MEDLRTLTAVSEMKGAKRTPFTRFRAYATAVVLALAAMGGIFMWRLRSLGELPDVGDPVDVALALRPVFVPEGDNAFVLYAAARLQVTKSRPSTPRGDLAKLTWATAGPSLREYVAENRPALDTWREGSERPDALYHQPGELSLNTALAMVDDLRLLGALAGLEGSRLEEQGAMGGAWSWYKAMLRSSRHVGRNGVIMERLVGSAIHERAAKRILRWAEDPRVDGALLRRALADALAADALTSRLSDNMKLEYLMIDRDLNELRVVIDDIPMPGGRNGLLDQLVKSKVARAQVQKIHVRTTNDVARSRRVLRLLFANWLPQMDKPPGERARIAVPLPIAIYAADATAPEAARAISPEDLDAAIGRTLLAQEFLRPAYWSKLGGAPWSGAAWEGDGVLAREPRRRAVLIVKLAAEIYRRERGSLPATAGALVDGYLKELPAGITPDEAIPAWIE